MKTTIKGIREFKTKDINEVIKTLDVDLFTDKQLIRDTSGDYLAEYNIQEDDITYYTCNENLHGTAEELTKVHPSELPDGLEWRALHHGEVNVFDEGIRHKLFTITTVLPGVKTSSKTCYSGELLELYYDSMYELILANKDGVVYITASDLHTGEVEFLSTDRQDIIDTFTQVNVKKQLSM